MIDRTWQNLRRLVLAMPIAMVVTSLAALAQPAQNPPPQQKPEHAEHAKDAPHQGKGQLSAHLVEMEKLGGHGGAGVEVEVTGVDLIDPATVGEKPKDGQGHLHYQIDEGPIIATTAIRLSFHQLKPGSHKLKVMLAANDHSPLGPAQELTIPGDVKAGPGNTAAAPQEKGKQEPKDKKEPEKGGDAVAHAKDKATLSAKLIDQDKNAQRKAATVEVDVGGVVLVDPLSASGHGGSGQGHLHYQVDDGPVIATDMKKLSFHELKTGAHKIKVVIANPDHSPMGAPQTLAVTIP